MKVAKFPIRFITDVRAFSYIGDISLKPCYYSRLECVQLQDTTNDTNVHTEQGTGKTGGARENINSPVVDFWRVILHRLIMNELVEDTHIDGLCTTASLLISGMLVEI